MPQGFIRLNRRASLDATPQAFSCRPGAIMAYSPSQHGQTTIWLVGNVAVNVAETYDIIETMLNAESAESKEKTDERGPPGPQG